MKYTFVVMLLQSTTAAFKSILLSSCEPTAKVPVKSSHIQPSDHCPTTEVYTEPSQLRCNSKVPVEPRCLYSGCSAAEVLASKPKQLCGDTDQVSTEPDKLYCHSKVPAKSCNICDYSNLPAKPSYLCDNSIVSIKPIDLHSGQQWQHQHSTG